MSLKQQSIGSHVAQFEPVTSLEAGYLVVFYYLGASEIWPDKRDSLW